MSAHGTGSPAPSERRRPASLLIGLMGTAVEILGLIIGAIWMLIDELAREALPFGAAMAVTLLLFAALLALGWRALWRGMRWGRGPIITWQLLQGITAVTMWDLLSIAVSIAVAALSVIVMIALLTPRSLAAAEGTIDMGGRHDDAAA